jgi:hypothetical protein
VITSEKDLLRAPIQWPVWVEHQCVPADLVHELGQRGGIALEAVWVDLAVANVALPTIGAPWARCGSYSPGRG